MQYVSPISAAKLFILGLLATHRHPQIHWFSIFNSFMMVIFLVGLVTMILMRTLRKDFARYSKDEELDDIVSWSGYLGRREGGERTPLLSSLSLTLTAPFFFFFFPSPVGARPG